MNALKYQWNRAYRWLRRKHGFSEPGAKTALVACIILYFLIVPFPLDIGIVILVALFGNDGTRK